MTFPFFLLFSVVECDQNSVRNRKVLVQILPLFIAKDT
jgi:hypothetical protein